MENNLLDLCGKEGDEPLDPAILSPSAKALFDGYVSLVNLQNLPQRDTPYFERISTDYIVSKVLDFIRGALKRESVAKAFRHGRIRDFYYFVPMVDKMLKGTAVKKENFDKRYRDVSSFIKAYGGNPKLGLIQEHYAIGRVDISDGDVYAFGHIIENCSFEEIREGLQKCFKGSLAICSSKYIDTVMKGVHAETEIQREAWVQEEKDEAIQIKMLEAEEHDNKMEIKRAEGVSPWEEEDKKLIEQILAMGNRDDKKEA